MEIKMLTILQNISCISQILCILSEVIGIAQELHY